MDNQYSEKDALKILKECSYFGLGLNGENGESVIGPERVRQVKEFAITALEAQMNGNFSNHSMDDYSLQELVALGYEQDIVKLGVQKVNDSSDIICLIGDEWFYFGGTTAEGYDSVEKFKEDIPVEDILSEICSTLEDYKKCASYNACYNKVYNYCLQYLKENIRIIDAQVDPLISIFKEIQYQNWENGTTIPFATQFNDFSLRQIAEELIKRGLTIK